LPPPHLIIVVAGLNDVAWRHEPWQPNGHMKPDTRQRREFLHNAVSGLTALRYDLDRDGRSLVLWAGFGSTRNAINQLRGYRDYIKDRVGKTGWPEWLHYKDFVGKFMEKEEAYAPDGRRWHSTLAAARCTDLLDSIKNLHL
jgi:hypothetical protein